jgi:phage gp29-like protein
MDREWWARFLDRYGSPFLVGTYDRGDSNSKSVLERAFSLAVKLGGLVVADGTNVEIKEAAAASTGEAYERFLTLCNREISKLILGQTLSAEAAPTGELGGGTARMQEEVRQDIRKFDAAMLADTLRDQLFSQFLAINGVRAAPPVISFGSDSADNIRATMTLVQSAYAAGLELDDDGLAAVNKLTGITLRRRAAMSPLPFTAREVGAVHPFSLQTLPALRRR